MQITRRDALVGASVAAVTITVTSFARANDDGLTVAALAGDPVLPAFEAFKAARLEAIAASDYRLAIVEAVEDELRRSRTLTGSVWNCPTPKTRKHANGGKGAIGA